MTELSEIIKALKVTANTVRGNGMLMCAGTIDWAIENLLEGERHFGHQNGGTGTHQDEGGGEQGDGVRAGAGLDVAGEAHIHNTR